MLFRSPEVKGKYTVKYKFPMGDDQTEESVDLFEPNENAAYWHDYIRAYIPVPIPEYVRSKDDEI